MDKWTAQAHGEKWMCSTRDPPPLCSHNILAEGLYSSLKAPAFSSRKYQSFELRSQNHGILRWKGPTRIKPNPYTAITLQSLSFSFWLPAGWHSSRTQGHKRCTRVTQLSGHISSVLYLHVKHCVWNMMSCQGSYRRQQSEPIQSPEEAGFDLSFEPPFLHIYQQIFIIPVVLKQLSKKT